MSEDELRPLARELVDLARSSQTPSNAHRERAYQSLVAGLGGAATVGSVKVGSAAAKVAGSSALAWLKWAVPAAVLAAAGGGGYLLSAHRHLAPPLAPRAITAPMQAAAPGAAPPPNAPSIDSSAPPAPSDSPEPSTGAATKAQPAAKAGGDLEQELSLLHQALAKSRSGDAAGALALAREHAREYPNSRLRIERDAIEVRSLCQLGRAAEAHKIADRLRSQAPGSPVSAALEETCVGK